MKYFFPILISVLFVPGQISIAQTWREVPLPAQASYIFFAGNPIRSGALALWSEGKPFTDSSLSVWFTPSHFFTSSNSGFTWNIIDSSHFTMIDKPPLRYYEAPYELFYVGENIIRTTFVSQDIDQFSYSFEYRSGNNAFIKKSYRHPITIDVGTQDLFLTDQNELFNTYLHLDEADDSTTFALLKSTDGGSAWQFVPDSINGLQKIPRVTTLAFRPKFPSVMYLGTVNGILRSADEGNTWQIYPTNSALDSMHIRFIHVQPGDPNLIYACGYTLSVNNNNDVLFRTPDNGLHWDQVFSDTLILQIATSESDPRIALINASSGLYRSTDRGANWSSAQGDLIPPEAMLPIETIHIDPGNATRAYAAYATKLFVTDNLLDVRDKPSPASSFQLAAPFPNPFVRTYHQGMTIQYTLNHPEQHISIRITDLLGRTIFSRSYDDNQSGENMIRIDRSVLQNAAQGLYFFTLTADEGIRSQKFFVR